MDNWDYMKDSDTRNLPFLVGMSPTIPFPHSNSSATTEELLGKWNDPVLSKSNTSLSLSNSRPAQTFDVIGGVTGSFDLNFSEGFPFPDDFLAPENIAQPLTERNNYCFGGHSTEEREHLVSDTVGQLSDADNALLASPGKETSLMPTPQTQLSPGSKENFHEDLTPGCMPRSSSGGLSKQLSNSFIPTLSLSEPASSVKRRSRVMTNKRLCEPNYYGFEEGGFDSRQNGQQLNEPTAVVFRKISKNSRCSRSAATRSLVKNADTDQKDVIHQMLNKRHDLRKDPAASSASLAKALGDHLYTLNARSKSLPELPIKAEVSADGRRSLAGMPSFLEAFLLCPSKLNPNIGSDELLNTEELLKSVPGIRSVIREEKRWLASYNRRLLKLQGRQTAGDSISYKNGDTLDASADSCDIVGDNSHSMDTGEDKSCAFSADVANLELHKPLLGIDALLDNDFAMDVEWTCSDSHGSDNSQGFGNHRLNGNDMMMEHKYWVNFSYFIYLLTITEISHFTFLNRDPCIQISLRRDLYKGICAWQDCLISKSFSIYKIIR